MGENTEKYITLSIPIKKEHDNGKATKKKYDNGKTTKKKHDNGKTTKKKHGNNKETKTTIYRLKFVESYRFMQDSLSNLVDNLSEIGNKEPKNKFTDSMRSVTDSLSESIDKV